MFRTGAIVIFMTILSANFALGSEWYQGGSLHKSTLGQWSGSSFRNKLATSGDFVTSMRGSLSIKLRTIEDVKSYAIEMVKCIDKSASDSRLGGQRASEIAAACAILMRW